MSLTRINVRHVVIGDRNVFVDGVSMGKVKNRAKICALFISVATVLPSGCTAFKFCDELIDGLQARTSRHTYNQWLVNVKYSQMGLNSMMCSVTISGEGYIPPHGL